MKTVLLKDNHITGRTTIAHPLSRSGRQSDSVSVKEVRNVPDEFSLAELIALWNRTCDMTWLRKGGDPMTSGRFVFDFSELGEGKVLLT